MKDWLLCLVLVALALLVLALLSWVWPALLASG